MEEYNTEDDNLLSEEEYQKLIKELNVWIAETNALISKSAIFLKNIQMKYDDLNKKEKLIKKY